MNSSPNQELAAFQTFVSKMVATGVDLSPEEVLDQWRELHPEPEDEFEDDVAAIQAALDDVANGDRGIPLEEFDREIRKKFNLPDRQ